LVEAANTRAISAEGALAAAVAEREALRAHIGVIERERDDLADVIKTVRADLEVTQAELAMRGESLLLTKHELAAAEERSRSAITSLQNELAVSRDVGRAALLALRSEAGGLPAEPRDAGWLTSLLRLLGLRATVSLRSAG
jgi:chromosome segregation ATPase